MQELEGINFRPLRLPKPKRKKQDRQTEKPMDPTLLQSLGQVGLGAAGAVGNLLSLPGSSVVDALAGRNPVDQWMTPFSDVNRTSGRELNRMYGLAGKKDTWGNFAGGLATEVLTDPNTLLGLSAFGKTAKAASKIKAGQSISKSLAKGIKAGDRALLRMKVPFGPEFNIGTGKRAVKLAGKVDRLAQKVKGSGFGRATAAMFDRTVKGTLHPVAQAFSRNHTRNYEQGLPQMRTDTLMVARELDNLGLTDPKKLRADIEWKGAPGQGPRPSYLPDGLRKQIKYQLEQTRLQREAYGLPSESLDDFYASYFPRSVQKMTPNKGDAEAYLGSVGGVKSKRDVRRETAFRDFKDSTTGVNKIFQDPKVAKVIEFYDGGKISRQKAISTIKKHLVKNYKGEFRPAYFKTAKDGSVLLDASGSPMVKSRASKISSYLVDHWKEEMSPDGLFNRTPLKDLSAYRTGSWKNITKAHALNETMFNFLPDGVKALKPAGVDTSYALGGNFGSGQLKDVTEFSKSVQTLSRRAMRKSGEKSFAQLWKKLGYKDAATAAQAMLLQHGIDPSEDAIKSVLNTRLPEDAYHALGETLDKFSAPKQVKPLGKAFDSYMSWFKATVLAHPATKIRDLMGGMAQGILHGITTPLGYVRAHKVYTGGEVKGLAKKLSKNKDVQTWAARNGMSLATDKDATDTFRYLYAAEGPGDIYKHSDVTGSVMDASSQGLEDVLGTVPGHKPSTAWGNIKSVGRTLIGKDGATLNPLDVRGVGGRADSKFAPVAAAEKSGAYTDTLNRMAPFLDMLSNGWEPQAAMKRINDIHVNYSPETFTDTETFLKRYVFPFYSYTSRMAKHTAKELVEKPGGRLANAIRAQNTARDKSGETPDHIADTSAIMFSDNPDTGVTRYLSGLGLMHQDPLDLASPNVLSEVGSRMNPLIQKFIEGATGSSMYFKGPDGGRPINELDPTIGRILANVSGSQDAVKFPGSGVAETALSLTPYSRWGTTLRQLTDPRKDIGTKLSNTLTGVRFTDVSPQAKERTIKRRLEEAAKSLGARTHSSVYFPAEQTLSGQAKERVDAYKELISALGRKAQKRKKDQIKDKKKKG